MPLKLALTATTVVVALAAVLACMIAFFPPQQPPPMASMSKARLSREVGGDIQAALADAPPVQRFPARDGSSLAYRFYPGRPGGGVAVVVHGSSGSSLQVHLAAKALADAGVTVVSPDIRGHGDSGPRGDIRYYGQLEDDMDDLASMLSERFPRERRVLIGHSSGGAFALRIASLRGDDFDGYIALSPFIAPAAPTARPRSGGWASVSVPRLIALIVLNRLGVHAFNGLPTLAFAVPRGAEGLLTETYSFNLMGNFGLPPQGWRQALRAIGRPTVVLVAGADEMMRADRYAPMFATLNPSVAVHIVPKVDHMGMTFAPSALETLVKTSRHLLG